MAIIHEIEKSNMEKIRIQVTEYKGHELIDIRFYLDVSTDKAANFKPTKKGISIPVRLAEELLEGIEKAVKQIKQAEIGSESVQEGR